MKLKSPQSKFSVFFAVFFALTTYAQEDSSTRPNIIVILSDDLGYSDIGSFGSEIPTPNLDKLADNGLRFAQFYNHARCVPTRASLLTGLYNHQTGVGNMISHGTDLVKLQEAEDNSYGYTGQLNFDNITIAEVLKASGYHTYMTGKWHLGEETPAYYPVSRGFDKFYGILSGATNYFRPKGRSSIYMNNEKIEITDPDYYTTNAFTDNAINFIKEQNDDKPFFLYLAYNTAHTPLMAPKEDIAKVSGLYDEGWDVIRNNRFEKIKKIGLVSKDFNLSAAAVKPWSELSKKEQNDQIKKMTTYAAMIYNMDKNIGKLMKFLTETGIAENTLIIYLSDNGATFNTDFWNMCNAPFTGHKRQTYEGGISAHTIVSWPKVIKKLKGKITSTPADIIDIMPTILQVSKSEYPENFNGHKIHALEGKSLLPVFKTGTRSEPKWFYWEHDNNYGVRNKEWKAVRPSDKTAWELYNLKLDRGETKNMANDQPEKLKELTLKWQLWANSHYVFPKPESEKQIIEVKSGNEN